MWKVIKKLILKNQNEVETEELDKDSDIQNCNTVLNITVHFKVGC